MNDKLRFLYSYKGIKKLFEDAFNLDIHDYKTMEFYVRRNLSEFTAKDLKIMLRTLERDKNVGQTIISFGSNIFNGIIALLAIVIAIFMAFIAVVGNNTEYYFITNLIFIFLFVVVISLYFIFIMRIIRIKNLLQNIIEIAIHIKKIT